MKKPKVLYKRVVHFLALFYIIFHIILKKPKYRNALVGLFCGILFVVAISVIISKNIQMNDSEASVKEYEALKAEYSLSDIKPKTEVTVRTVDEPKEDVLDTLEVEIAVDEWELLDYKSERDETSDSWYTRIDVDFEGLKDVNPDIIGWICFEAADISYPVMFSGDDAKYLRTSFDGKSRVAGSIFLEGENNPDFSDKHSIVYGHNMKNTTMFGQLLLYKSDSDYYDNHQYFQLIYPDADTGQTIKERYHIFSCKEVKDDDSIYYIYDKNFDKLSEFSDNVIRPGNLLSQTSGITVTNEDKVITLSTCSGTSGRLVVSAVKCAECTIDR